MYNVNSITDTTFERFHGTNCGISYISIRLLQIHKTDLARFYTKRFLFARDHMFQREDYFNVTCYSNTVG